jgi:TonB family protein
MPQKLLRAKKIGISLAFLVPGSVLPAAAQAGAGGQGATIQLPQMAGGGGDKAIVRAIQQKVKYPKQALRDLAQGQSMVTFVVAPSGQVCLLHVKYAVRADLDSAVVRAVREMPRLQPARQNGQPVAVMMSVPATFAISNPPRLPRRPLPALDSTQVYTAVTRMPAYQGESTSFRRLSADLTAEYVRLSQGTTCGVPYFGRTIVATVGPSGTLYNVRLAPPDAAQQAAMNAQFGGQVAQSEADEETELSEVCEAQLAEAARHLPRLTPAYVDGRPVAMRLLLSLLGSRPY